MKLPIVCPTCMSEDIANARPIATVELRDDGRYDILCPKGHRGLVILQQQKFEILFDIGAYAISDGYYREAVSSFAASIERFYEFWIYALMLQKGVDSGVINVAWKSVSAQSERQLGAFMLLYAQECGQPAPSLSNKLVSFRNDVVHKGKIPTRAEAIEYGQAILDLIRPLMEQARERLPLGVQKTVFRHLRNRIEADDGRPVATVAVPTIVSISVTDPSHHQRSLAEALTQLVRWQ